jgi:predicted ATPase
LLALSLIHKLVGQNSQFIIATHSPILLSYPNALIYQVDSSGINKVDYEDTEPYRITKHFLNNHQEMLDMLFEEE